jgi:virginiamycin B lyase
MELTPHRTMRLAKTMHAIKVLVSRSLCFLPITSFFLCTSGFLCSSGNGQAQPARPPRPGVTTPGVRRSMADLHPDASFAVEGEPDWMVVTDDAVWVTSSNVNHVVRLDPATNRAGLVVTIDKPCSGLASGFGAIWVPSCGAHALVRVDPQTGKTAAQIPAGPADSEGGITVGAGSVWLATEKQGLLVRVDPQTNQVVAKIAIAPGSYAPAFGEGAVWITSTEHNLLTHVDAKSNRVVATIPIGPQPRFLTVGAGSVWTLNQGDGTVSRIDMKTNRLTATIPVGIPGTGGEIAFGEGSVWATVFQIPMSRIDPATNAVVQQWVGSGGDSIRVGHGSIWLTDFAHATVWRLNPKGL